MVKQKRARKKQKVKPKRRLNRRIYAVILASICLIAIAYFFWPRLEYVSVKGGIAIVDSFYSSTSQFTDETYTFLQSKGMNVDVFKDENVTVNLYARLPQYGHRLIILRVHAGILEKDPTKPTFLFTNELYNTGEYVWEQLVGQIQAGKTNPDNEEEAPVFTVGPLFVLANGDFNDSIVILSSCLGLYNYQLADAFYQKGAKVFISWDEKVSLKHTDDACTLLLKALIEDEMSIEEAIKKVMIEIGPDTAYNSVLTYYPEEAGSLKLKP